MKDYLSSSSPAVLPVPPVVGQSLPYTDLKSDLSDLFPDESQFRFGVFITDGGARRMARMCVEAVAAAEHVKLDAED